jgi:hypothetical protein
MTVAPHQQLYQTVNGQQIASIGTVLLFDLRHYPLPFYKAMIRVTPVVSWTDPSVAATDSPVAVGAREIYIGNAPGAYGHTLILIAFLVGGIAILSRRITGRASHVLCGPDGRLSLARVQVAAWTIAVGGVVVAFGLVRLEVPEIPESLVVLMGLSFLTGGISYFQANKTPPPPPPLSPDPRRAPALADLVRESAPGQDDGRPSLARAQMVFWTGLLLVLFVAKSLLDGAIWAVPWQMVALMGISQAGYLSPKMLQ